MKAEFSRSIIILLIIIQVNWASSCSGGPGNNNQPDTLSGGQNTSGLKADSEVLKLIKVVSPEENTGFKLKDPVRVVLDLVRKDRSPDSVLIYFDGKRVTSLKSEPWEYTIPPSFTQTTGRKSLKIAAYFMGRTQNPVTRFMIVYSDKVPVRCGYKILHTYPHDREAFTQGLVFDGNVFYEGTGQKTGSTLREVELQTGKVIRQHNLDASLFGEGITLFNNRIYQVTWENKVGFVYDKATFNVINRIYYSTQGWGLTTVNDRIVMSDGSNVLSFYEPDMFTIVSRIEVYDNEKKVESLNELEYINGEIWANIWTTDLIARIDPVSGKVIAYIDLAGLLPEQDRAPDTDVLNGIAFDAAGGRIFVTGKKWPKLFEIKITE